MPQIQPTAAMEPEPELGESLWTQSSASPEKSSLAAPEPRLTLFHGDDQIASESLPEGHQLVLGRTLKCDLHIPHPSVSRTHARIWSEDGATWIDDLGTVHGTLVDDLRVNEPTRLDDGAQITLGRSGGDGWRLCFADPSLALLRDMGLLEPASSTTPEDSEPAVETSPADPGEDTQEPPALEAPNRGESSLSDETPKNAEMEVDDDAPPPPTSALSGTLALARNPFLQAGVVLILAMVAAVAWATRAMQPSALAWRWVHLTPPEASAGVTLGLDSPDIRADGSLRVELGGVDVEPRLLPGRLELRVPELESQAFDARGLFATPGRYDVPLVVRGTEVEVFRTSVSYLVTPRVASIEPAAVEEGAVVTLSGRYLVGSEETSVLIGDTAAEVLEAASEHLRVRVPELGSDRTHRQAVTVRVGPWSGRSPVTLEVRVPPPAPDPPLFAVHRHAGGWWARPIVGPAVAYPSRSAAEVGARAWNELFDRAATDPTLTIQAESDNVGYALRVNGDSLTTPLLLGRWRAEHLHRMTGESGVEATLLLHWLATVWNPLLDAMGRGVLPEVDRGGGLGPRFADALAALALEREALASAQDRPHRHLGGRLEPTVQRELAGALRAFPKHMADAAGRWSGRLENVFFTDDGYRCLLELDLRRSEATLSGTARLSFTNPDAGINLALPEVPVHGWIRPGPSSSIELQASFGKPVGDLELLAEFAGGRLLGFYRGPEVRNETARWQAERYVDPKPAF